jgi:hypothetical protein
MRLFFAVPAGLWRFPNPFHMGVPMSVTQLSVFVENRTGHLADVLGTLADGGVNVLAFAIADTIDYGILRLVVDKVEPAKDLLKAADHAVVDHQVVCTVIPDEPGVLASIVRLVAESGLDIEYVYLGARHTLLLKAEEFERLEELLVAKGLRVLGPGDEL